MSNVSMVKYAILRWAPPLYELLSVCVSVPKIVHFSVPLQVNETLRTMGHWDTGNGDTGTMFVEYVCPPCLCVSFVPRKLNGTLGHQDTGTLGYGGIGTPGHQYTGLPG